MISNQPSLHSDKTVMRNISLCTLILCSFSFFVQSAFAGFSGNYDVSNWTPFIDSGSIDLSGAPTSISITSGNNTVSEFISNQDFVIAATGAGMVGTVGFDWNYFTKDEFDSAEWDPFGYVLNGNFNQLTDDNGGASQSGTVEFSVSEGDVFGFRAHSVDSILGAATTTISNFYHIFVPVPEPGTILLFGTGIVYLFSIRRKMKPG